MLMAIKTDKYLLFTIDYQFLPLVKECFELTVGDYIYKHCLMDYW